MGLTKPEIMAEPFTAKMLILAAILGARLPSVTPYDYNTCKGGLIARTCQNQYSSHCCMSRTFLSATCCRNSCKATWSRSSASTCKDITESMCCSTDAYGPESCCNFASYSRTSLSSVKGYYHTCTGGPTIQYCTNSLSRSCCRSGGYNSASCCRIYTCGGYETSETCYSFSTYCCSSSQRCCDDSSYKKEQRLEDERKRRVKGEVTGLTIGLPILLMACVMGTVLPIIFFGRRKCHKRPQNDTTPVSVTAASNPAEDQAASPQPGPEDQPPPNEHPQPPTNGINQPPPYQSLFPSQPQSGPTVVVPPNGSQPPPYEHHQLPPPRIDQPPPYQSQQQFQAPLAPQPQSGSNQVKSVTKFEMTLDRTSGK